MTGYVQMQNFDANYPYGFFTFLQSFLAQSPHGNSLIYCVRNIQNLVSFIFSFNFVKFLTEKKVTLQAKQLRACNRSVLRFLAQ